MKIPKHKLGVILFALIALPFFFQNCGGLNQKNSQELLASSVDGSVDSSYQSEHFEVESTSAASQPTLNLLYGDAIANSKEQNVLQQDIQAQASLSGRLTTNMSNFPYPTFQKGVTFIYFSQLLRDPTQPTAVHGGGSVPVVAVRLNQESGWKYFTLFKFVAGRNVLNSVLAELILDANVLQNGPLILRDYVISKVNNSLTINAFLAPKGFGMYSVVKYEPTERKFFRSGYASGRVWLFQSDNLIGKWNFRRPSATEPICPPMAAQDGFDFTEADIVRINEQRWVGIIRENLGIYAIQHNSRRLFQVESQDGCHWSKPVLIGDGTQPHLLRMRSTEQEDRIVLCVGDRIAFGQTKEIGIQCRASNNLITIGQRPVVWGAPKMIFTVPDREGSDLGQPASIQLGWDNIETYFYANPRMATGTTGTEIFVVRHRLRQLPKPLD